MAVVAISRIASLARKLPGTYLFTTPIHSGLFTPEHRYLPGKIEECWWPIEGSHLVRLDPENRPSATYLLVEAKGAVSGWSISFEDEGWTKARQFPLERVLIRACPNLQARLLRLREYSIHTNQQKAHWEYDLLKDMGFCPGTALSIMNITEHSVLPTFWWMIDLLSERSKDVDVGVICDFLIGTLIDPVRSRAPYDQQRVLSAWQTAGITIPRLTGADSPALHTIALVDKVLGNPVLRGVLLNLVEKEEFVTG